MGLFGWLKGKGSARSNSTVAGWHKAWEAAVAQVDPDVAALEAALTGLALSEDEIEIEREMLAGLEQLIELRRSMSNNGLPAIETGHRIVGSDVCHFSAPASRPDDPAQPSGRLILTNARAILAGGAKALAVPWHAVVQVLQTERDIALIRVDREALYRFRCNSFAEAMCGAFIARTLAGARNRALKQEAREARS
jgi:hypothetical protein